MDEEGDGSERTDERRHFLLREDSGCETRCIMLTQNLTCKIRWMTVPKAGNRVLDGDQVGGGCLLEHIRLLSQ